MAEERYSSGSRDYCEARWENDERGLKSGMKVQDEGQVKGGKGCDTVGIDTRGYDIVALLVHTADPTSIHFTK